MKHIKFLAMKFSVALILVASCKKEVSTQSDESLLFITARGEYGKALYFEKCNLAGKITKEAPINTSIISQVGLLADTEVVYYVSALGRISVLNRDLSVVYTQELTGQSISYIDFDGKNLLSGLFQNRKLNALKVINMKSGAKKSVEIELTEKSISIIKKSCPLFVSTKILSPTQATQSDLVFSFVDSDATSNVTDAMKIENLNEIDEIKTQKLGPYILFVINKADNSLLSFYEIGKTVKDALKLKHKGNLDVGANLLDVKILEDESVVLACSHSPSSVDIKKISAIASSDMVTIAQIKLSSKIGNRVSSPLIRQSFVAFNQSGDLLGVMTHDGLEIYDTAGTLKSKIPRKAISNSFFLGWF